MFEVYLDGCYYKEFETEEKAKSFCEARNWCIPDYDWGFDEPLSYREVEEPDDAIILCEYYLPPVYLGEELITPTQYYVLRDRNVDKYWMVEYKTASGKIGYIKPSEYNKLAKFS